jgi:hypothetical protein
MFSAGTGSHFVKDFFAELGTFCGASMDEAEGTKAVAELTLSN